MDRIELTDEQRDHIEKLAECLTQEQIADFLGFTGRTLRNIFTRDEEAYSAYKRGQARAINDIASNLIQKARGGDTTSQIFFLKTKAGWRETNETIVKAEAPFTGFVIERAEPDPASAD